MKQQYQSRLQENVKNFQTEKEPVPQEKTEAIEAEALSKPQTESPQPAAMPVSHPASTPAPTASEPALPEENEPIPKISGDFQNAVSTRITSAVTYEVNAAIEIFSKKRKAEKRDAVNYLLSRALELEMPGILTDEITIKQAQLKQEMDKLKLK